MLVARACIRPAALAQEATTAARSVSLRAASARASATERAASARTSATVRLVSAVSRRVSALAYCAWDSSAALWRRSRRVVSKAYARAAAAGVSRTAAAPPPQASGALTVPGATETAPAQRRPVTAAEISRAGQTGRREERKSSVLWKVVPRKGEEPSG